MRPKATVQSIIYQTKTIIRHKLPQTQDSNDCDDNLVFALPAELANRSSSSPVSTYIYVSRAAAVEAKSYKRTTLTVHV